MPDVRRGKKVGSFALFDALAQRAGWPEIGDNAGARGLVISLAEFAEHLAQAAGSQHVYLVGSRRPNHPGSSDRRQHQYPHPSPHMRTLDRSIITLAE